MMSLQTAAGRSVATQGDAMAKTTSLIQAMGPQLARALPKHMSSDRLTRIILTEVRKNPKLAQCSQASFAGAILMSATLGVEPGVQGECYLVPYKGEVGFILGYQGMIKLFFQHPLAKDLAAHVVYENDDFEYELGLEPRLVHRPANGDRGAMTHVYAVGRLTTGATDFEVLTVDEVRNLRGRLGTKGDIPDPQHWMERKTAIRQLMKRLPKSYDLTIGLDADERLGSELARTVQMEPIQAPEAELSGPEAVQE